MFYFFVVLKTKTNSYIQTKTNRNQSVITCILRKFPSFPFFSYFKKKVCVLIVEQNNFQKSKTTF